MSFSTDPTLTWLLVGDPAIRWQTRRDLLDEPPEAYDPDRARVATEGWGAQLLARQDPASTWADALHSPKWTSITYTLLRHLGLPPENAQARRGCALLLERGFYRDGGINLFRSGNSDYFCDLSVALQNEIIQRTKHQLF